MPGADPLDLTPASDLLDDMLEARLVEVPAPAVVPSEPAEGKGVDLRSKPLVKNAEDMLGLSDYPTLSTEQKVFLIAFAAHGTVSQAVVMSGVSPRNHRKWLKEDEEYQEAFATAIEVHADKLEEVSLKASMDPLNSGERMFHLKARRPDKYAPKAAVAVKGDIKHTHSMADLARQAFSEGVLDGDDE
jgi:hypothetical protein